MEPFTTLTAIAAPMPMQNIDTDKVIPARFLKTIKRSGLGVHLFDSLRYDKDGNERPDFVLNQEPYRKAEIIVQERLDGSMHLVFKKQQLKFKTIEKRPDRPMAARKPAGTGSASRRPYKPAWNHPWRNVGQKRSETVVRNAVVSA